MGIEDFNRGLDDACEGNFRSKYAGNSDYMEGYTYGEDIDREIDYNKSIQKDYEEYMNKQREEDFFKKEKGK